MLLGLSRGRGFGQFVQPALEGMKIRTVGLKIFLARKGSNLMGYIGHALRGTRVGGKESF